MRSILFQNASLAKASPCAAADPWKVNTREDLMGTLSRTPRESLVVDRGAAATERWVSQEFGSLRNNWVRTYVSHETIQVGEAKIGYVGAKHNGE